MWIEEPVEMGSLKLKTGKSSDNLNEFSEKSEDSENPGHRWKGWSYTGGG